LEIEVKGGRWMLTSATKPRAPKPVLHYWPDDE
jgi:hypothetical protein